MNWAGEYQKGRIFGTRAAGGLGGSPRTRWFEYAGWSNAPTSHGSFPISTASRPRYPHVPRSARTHPAALSATSFPRAAASFSVRAAQRSRGSNVSANGLTVRTSEASCPATASISLAISHVPKEYRCGSWVRSIWPFRPITW